MAKIPSRQGAGRNCPQVSRPQRLHNRLAINRVHERLPYTHVIKGGLRDVEVEAILPTRAAFVEYRPYASGLRDHIGRGQNKPNNIEAPLFHATKLVGILGDVKPVDFVNLRAPGVILFERPEDDLFPGLVPVEIEGPGADRVPANFGMADYMITADLNITDPENVQGVILANGGDTSGFSLYVDKEHHLVFEYNYLNLTHTKIVSEEELSGEDTSVEFVFDYNDDPLPICFEPTDQTIPKDLVQDLVADLLHGLDQEEIKADVQAIASEKVRTVGCSGTGSFSVDGNQINAETFVNGHQVDSDRIDKTFMGKFTDSFDVGMDMRGPVSEEYEPPFEFTGGEIKKVTIHIDPSI